MRVFSVSAPVSFLTDGRACYVLALSRTIDAAERIRVGVKY